eukprot:6804095-Prymnesium_polylepis.1
MPQRLAQEQWKCTTKSGTWHLKSRTAGDDASEPRAGGSAAGGGIRSLPIAIVEPSSYNTLPPRDRVLRT